MEDERKERLNLFCYSKQDNRLIEHEGETVVLGTVNQRGEFTQNLFPVTDFEIKELKEAIPNKDPRCDYFSITTDDGRTFGFRINEFRGKCYPLFRGIPFENLKKISFDTEFSGYIIGMGDSSIFTLEDSYQTDEDMEKASIEGVEDILYARSGVYIFKDVDGGESIQVNPKDQYRYFSNKEAIKKFNENKEYIYPLLSGGTKIGEVLVIDKNYGGIPLIHSINKSTCAATKKILYYIDDRSNMVDKRTKFKSVKYTIKNPLYKYGTSYSPFVFVAEDEGGLLFVVPHTSYDGAVNCRYIGHIWRYDSEEEMRKHGSYITYDDEYVYAHMYDFTDANIEKERYSEVREKLTHDYYSTTNVYNDSDLDKIREKYLLDIENIENEHHEKLQKIYDNIKLIKKFPILKIDNEKGEMIELNNELYWDSYSSDKISGESLFIDLRRKCMYDTREKGE